MRPLMKVSFILLAQVMLLDFPALLVRQVNAAAGAAAASTSTSVLLDTAPAPAPAPSAPSFENVTQSLVYGGQYSTFIELLEETKVDVIFQSMANDSQGPGITIFAPTDDAFQTKLVSSRLKNLTASQKVSLVEYHALNVYQAFKNLQNANNNVTSTFATLNNGGAGRYHVNITFTGGGRLQITSGWTTAKISTTIYSEKPVSIFAIDQVLLPDEIFGLPPPPSPSPSPSPSASSSPVLKPTSSKDSSFSSPLFTPCISSLLFSFLLLQFLMISEP